MCTVATLSSDVGKRRSIEYQNFSIEFSKIAPSLFFGFTYVSNFYIATAEKAIWDTLYYRKTLPVMDELEMDEVKKDVLLDMAVKFPKASSKRLFALLGDHFRVQKL